MTNKRIGVAVIGWGWMGEVHARAYERFRHHYPDAEVTFELMAVADPVKDRLEDAARRFPFARTDTDWKAVVSDPAVDVISITAPNFLHQEIAIAAANAGKHLWLEKPVGVTSDDTMAVAEAVRNNGVKTAVGFNYRNPPAVKRARELVANGHIGTVTNAAFRFYSDYAAHPDGPLSWRFTEEQGGLGVLADLGSHGTDLIRFLLGDVEQIVAETQIVVPNRPLPQRTSNAFSVEASTEAGTVENSDHAAALMRLTTGSVVTLEISRVSVGSQVDYGFSIHGTKGSITWNFQHMGELVVAAGENYLDVTSTRQFVGPGVSAFGTFQPATANPMGFDDLKVIELADLVQAITAGPGGGATIEDAVAAAQAIDAANLSARSRAWAKVTADDAPHPHQFVANRT